MSLTKYDLEKETLRQVCFFWIAPTPFGFIHKKWTLFVQKVPQAHKVMSSN